MRRIPIIPVACQYGEKTLPQSWHGGPLFLKPGTLPEIYLKGEQLVLRPRGKVCLPMPLIKVFSCTHCFLLTVIQFM